MNELEVFECSLCRSKCHKCFEIECKEIYNSLQNCSLSRLSLKRKSNCQRLTDGLNLKMWGVDYVNCAIQSILTGSKPLYLDSSATQRVDKICEILIHLIFSESELNILPKLLLDQNLPTLFSRKLKMEK